MTATPATTAAADVCPQCGARFRCGMAGGDQECWCARLPALLPLPAQPTAGEPAAASCLCPACLQERLALAAEHAAVPGRGR